MSFTGRTAVVTGGSRGIGRAICLELARRGANVVFSYAGNTAAAEATRKELEALGVQTRAVQGSVADPAAVKTLIDTAVKELGSLDILVNNAGITRDNLAMMPQGGGLRRGHRDQPQGGLPHHEGRRPAHDEGPLRPHRQPQLRGGPAGQPGPDQLLPPARRGSSA